METRQKVNFTMETQVFFEAVVIDTKYNDTMTITRSSKHSLQDALKIQLNCGRYKLETIEMVTREIPKIA